MIIKSYEVHKINLNKNEFVLLHGKNEGLKIEIINTLVTDKKKVRKYEEKEIIDNPDNFIEDTISNSLFENEKIIIIKRVTDKLIKIIEEINTKRIENVYIIFNADNLEKKSKLRSFFEKNKTFASIAVYPETIQTLIKLIYNFLKDKKISISQSNINLIANKCNGDREALYNELKKIELYTKSGNKINSENIEKLINLTENHSILELIDNCLAKNKRKTVNILNENNFSNEDCILIARTFLSKSKKILRLSSEFKNNKNLDLTISLAKPPIFWKEKEITKQQIERWPPDKIKKLVYKLNEIELLIKKNINNSINLITDFILVQVSSDINS